MAREVQLINLTPHTINIYYGEDVGYNCQLIHPNTQPAIVLKPSGIVARVRSSYTQAAPIKVQGVVVPTKVGSLMPTVDGLPAPREGVMYVVSGMLDSFVYGRDDLVAPHSLVRDAEGRVIGCAQLLRLGGDREENY